MLYPNRLCIFSQRGLGTIYGSPARIIPTKKALRLVFLGGGVVRWGTRQPGMKKVLLGESEVLTPVKTIVKSKFVQNMDKS
jgi:hypothetical protein